VFIGTFNTNRQYHATVALTDKHRVRGKNKLQNNTIQYNINTSPTWSFWR